MNADSAFAYLVDTLIGLYAIAVLLRLLLQWVRADYYNPICQIIARITDPPILPLRRLLPSIGRFDVAAAVLLVLLEMLALYLQLLITGQGSGVQRMTTACQGAGLAALVVVALKGVVRMVLTTYLVLIIGSVLISWLGQGARHPVIPLIYQLTEPVLAPIRRILPPLGGLDLSPLVALIGIQFLIVLLGA